MRKAAVRFGVDKQRRVSRQMLCSCRLAGHDTVGVLLHVSHVLNSVPV